MPQLLATFSQVQVYLPIHNSLASAPPAAIADLLRTAQENYIHPAVSPELCGVVAVDPDAHGVLYTLLCRAVAHFAAASYVSLSAVQVTPSGLVQTNTDKQKAARSEDVELLRRSLLRSGYSEVEKALNFLEKNAVNYPVWTASQTYTLASNSLCPNATRFNRYLFINSSRRLFLALMPSLADVERSIIVQSVSPGVYAELLATPESALIPAQWVLLHNHVMPALCHLAYAQALPGFALIPDYDTLVVLTAAPGVRPVQSARANDIQGLSEHHQRIGEMALARIGPFVQANPIAFPLYPAAPLAAKFDNGLIRSPTSLYL